MFTLDQVMKATDAVVEKIGADTIYRERSERLGGGGSCVYVIKGHPACLVGVVLHHLGVPLDTLEGWRTTGITVAASHEPGVDIAPDAIDFLRFVQQQQDQDTRWGTAVTKAREYVARR